MGTRLWRTLGASVLLGFLFVFFLPITYDARLFACGLGGVCLTNDSGLLSVGYAVFHWGATYSFGYGSPSPLNGYFAPNVTIELTDLSSFGELLFIVFPLLVASLALLAPEIVRISRVARLGFAGFGAFTTMLSAIVLSAAISHPFLPEFVFLPLAWVGGLIAMYGTRTWIFSPMSRRDNDVPNARPSDDANRSGLS
jgi:hypothetical protein